MIERENVSDDAPKPEPQPISPKRTFLPPVYLPLVLTLAGLFISVFARSWQTRWLSFSGQILFLLGTVYFLIQALGRLFLRQWRASLFALGRLIFCVGSIIPAAFISLALGLAGPVHDGFADDLSIPAGVEIALPSKQNDTNNGTPDDFQQAALKSLDTTAGTDSAITPSLPSLRLLHQKDRALLIRYLSSSPAWRVFEENGSIFATRRWKLHNNWQWTLNGYYTPFAIGHEFESTNYFQSRISLGFSGKQLARGVPPVSEGTNSVPVALSSGNNADQSYISINCGGLLVELFEQSNGRERRLTKAAIRFLEDEFSKVLNAGKWSLDLLSESDFRRGSPTLDLIQSFQPGLYDVVGWLNPGEAGTVYLKAYEVTRNYRLSESRLYTSSNEQIGWSNKPNELFLYNTHITIYEGDWGKPYAARFELWFKPASGAAERKLLEQNFKIEGWQR